MRDPIPAVTVQLTKLVDDGNPPAVECRLTDSNGQTHIFIEKITLVSLLDDLPEAGGATGSICCQVLSSWQDDEGRRLTKVNTELPWHVTSLDGVSEFTVLSSQIHTI